MFRRLFGLGVLALSGSAIGQVQGWSGQLNLNLSATQSTLNVSSAFVNLRAVNKLKMGNQLEYSLFYGLSKQTNATTGNLDTTEDRWSIGAHYDTPSSRRKFGFIDQRFDRNVVVQLGSRSVTTIGYGYFAIRTENPYKTGRVDTVGDAEWKITAGLSYLTETYLNDLGSRNAPGLQFASSFRKVFKKGVSVNHYAEFYPAFDRFDDFLVVSNLNVGIPISQRISLAVAWIADYDATPAPGARKDNSRYALTLGYRF
jgi:putative salt-induced outer membrane protein YdiY